MEQPQKILAIKLRAIGDSVIWTAALQALREAHPSAEIHALTFASNAAVLQNHPAVTQLHLLHGKSHLELLRKLWSMRAQNLDWLLGFHATTSLCRWAWIAGAHKMALHHHSGQRTPRGSVTIPHPGQLEDAITRDHRVLEAMGIHGPRMRTRLWMTKEESEAAENSVQLAIRQSGGSITLPRFIFLPGASHHLRRYPKELWLPLASEVLHQGHYQPVVVVDQALSEEQGLRKACAEIGVPLIDQGSLREFMAVISRGERALANDSGPGHIAVALGLKTTFTFGPGCVGDWHPYSKQEHPVVRIQVPCRAQGPRDQEQFQFCTVDVCEHHRCMRELKVEVHR